MFRSRRHVKVASGLCWSLLVGVVPFGCTSEVAATDTPGGYGGEGTAGGGNEGGGGASGVERFAGVGEACSDLSPCRAGLDCQDDSCVPSGSIGDGSQCVIGAECAGGQCVLGLCAVAGSGLEGGACTADTDCSAGLRCELMGFSGVCQVGGEGDVGAECTESIDCYSGLFCADGKCAASSKTKPFGATPWTGVECEPLVDEGPVRAYFEIEGAEDALAGDFFRLPFPNDARRSDDGKLDLSGFPTPGLALLGFDPVARYVDAIEEADRGWGTSPAITFRFSNAIDPASLREEGRVNWIDITPDAPDYGLSAGWSWLASGSRTAYVCENQVLIKRPRGYPVLPGHIYAVYITRGVTDPDGGEVERSPNFASMMSNRPPADSALSQAYASFAPFRDYIEDQGIASTSILTASVLTIGAVRDTMAELAASVEAARIPEATDWVRCDSGVASPCPGSSEDSNGRGCDAADPQYDEYQAVVGLPIFQKGTAPYLTEGGGIVAGKPQRTEDVCLSLTVPKGTMPESGWPLVVFAHGTGGGFRDHVRPEVAGVLATAELQDGTPAGMAVLGIDQVQHASRRGESTETPENLFFNFANPDASRGNPLQGAADQLSLARFAESLSTTIDGRSITIDPEALLFFGHSQGSTEGSLMLPYSNRYRAAVLSGNGASLRDSLVSKTKPVDITRVLPLVLSDPALASNDPSYHPVLNLLQQWIDPADPLNFARLVAAAPLEGIPGHHVLQTYGLLDSYSPAPTMEAYALAAEMALVQNDEVDEPESIGLRTPVAPPLVGNLADITAGIREYEPATDRDGHFVVFDNARANADMVRFLAMAALGQIPAIGEE